MVGVLSEFWGRSQVKEAKEPGDVIDIVVVLVQCVAVLVDVWGRGHLRDSIVGVDVQSEVVVDCSSEDIVSCHWGIEIALENFSDGSLAVRSFKLSDCLFFKQGNRTR